MIATLSKVLQFEKVAYYTFHLEGRVKNEFRDFIDRAKISDNNQLAELNRFIQNIGQKYGAEEAHFKKEDNAERLPPPYHRHISTKGSKGYGLRLYCIRLTTKIVILLNGDHKKAQKVQDCPNCKKHFMMAKKIATAIDTAIRDKNIKLDGFDILLEDDFEIEL